jgi:hypothetical protein
MSRHRSDAAPLSGPVRAPVRRSRPIRESAVALRQPTAPPLVAVLRDTAISDATCATGQPVGHRCDHRYTASRGHRSVTAHESLLRRIRLVVEPRHDRSEAQLIADPNRVTNVDGQPGWTPSWGEDRRQDSGYPRIVTTSSYPVVRSSHCHTKALRVLP